MTRARLIPNWLATAATVVLTMAAAASARDNAFLLITGELEVEAVSLVEINHTRLVARGTDGVLKQRALDQCIAVVRPAPPALAPDPSTASANVLRLADGQRLPGLVAMGIEAKPDSIAWVHPWLGRLDVPLDHVRSLTLRGPEPTPGDGDVVTLTNGDRLDGLVVEVGPRHVVIELDDRPVEVPLDRVSALILVTPVREASGQRVWFHDTTRLDVNGLTAGDDGYVRFGTEWSGAATDAVEVRLSEVAAILFDSDRLVALSELPPARLEPITPRYVLPVPRSLDADAPLGLGPLELRGPVVVRYALPPRCLRFAAEAVLPESARAWGDFVLVVRDDDLEVFRQRLNAEHPHATVQVPLRGSELTIELQPGARGPVQDRLVLEHAMLLLDN